MYFYEEKTKQGYRLFTTIKSAKMITSKLVEEPFLIDLDSTVIVDEGDGKFYSEIRLKQLGPNGLFSELIFISLQDLTFKDLGKIKELIALLNQKSLNKLKATYTTTKKVDQQLIDSLNDLSK